MPTQQDKPTTDPSLTPRQKVERVLATLGFSNIGHADLVGFLDTAVAATYAEADEFIRGARTHAKAYQATRDIEGSLTRLAEVIRAAIPHAPDFYAVNMEDWAQRVDYAGMPEDSSNGLTEWAYEIADAMAHIGDTPLPRDEGDLEGV